MDSDTLISDSDSAPLIKSEGSDVPLYQKQGQGFPKARHVMAFIGFLGFVNVYALRVNLSVALVNMVNTTGSDSHNTTNETDECPGRNNSSNSDSNTGEFDWNQSERGIILGAFFYGYITTQILGGWLSERYGGKHLYGLGVLCTAVFTLLTPIAARAGFKFLIAVRVLEGIGEGVTFPAMHALLAQWAPPYERSKLATFIYAGAQLGTVISMPVSGLLCSKVGWSSVFYVFGALGCAWWILWVFLVYDSPRKHPRISPAEREYIEQAIGKEHKIKMATPWLSIFKSIRFWAILVGHVCNNWGFYTLLTCLPQYMSDVLHFDISQNGFLSGLPYLVMWIIMMGAGQVTDFLRFNHYMSTTTARKVNTAIGLGSPAVFLVVAGFISCDPALAVVVITLAVGLSGCIQAGSGINHLDIAPAFAGTLMGLTNSAATVPGFLGPLVAMAITKEHSNREQWRKVFFISAAVYAFGVLFYSVFGSGVEQEWAKPRKGMETVAVATSDEDDDDDGEHHPQRVDDVLTFATQGQH